jgi:dolichol-phosphate mannosyltransferase
MPGPPWLILPTYDEAENLEPVVDAARAALSAAAPEGFRILVVDDASPDGTGAIADGLHAAHPGEVDVLHRARREGLGPAYLAGFARALDAGAGFLCEMDADLSHDAADLARLLEVARAGAGLALGSRYVDGGGIADWGPLRRAVSRGGSWYARRVLGVDVRDLTGGFKCFRAEVLHAIDLPSVRSHGYAFQVELTYRTLCAGFDVVEVPIVFRDRRRGESKMSWRIAVEAAWLVPALRRGARAAVRRGSSPAQAAAAARRSDG